MYYPRMYSQEKIDINGQAIISHSNKVPCYQFILPYPRDRCVVPRGLRRTVNAYIDIIIIMMMMMMMMMMIVYLIPTQHPQCSTAIYVNVCIYNQSCECLYGITSFSRFAVFRRTESTRRSPNAK
jgi:hypothetical protein